MARLEVERKVSRGVRARIGTWPYEPDIAHLVLLDHHMQPTTSDVTDWIARARAEQPAARTIRTGAMFAEAADVFRAVGFATIDTLALLEAHLTPMSRRATATRRLQRQATQRLRAHHLPDAASLDRRAFGDPWGNDVSSLASISDATPHHRARIITSIHSDNDSDQLSGFAISGQSGVVGYLQRLAVHPDARRQGLASALVDDSMQWMRRRGATTAMVNTALDNDAALALYADAGFRRRPDTLTILELSDLRAPDPDAPDLGAGPHTR